MKMSVVNSIFERIHTLSHEEATTQFKYVPNNDSLSTNFEPQKTFLLKIFKEIDALATEIKCDDSILISVKNQKLLRTCFQLITSIGIRTSLIPGLGIILSGKCSSAVVPPQSLTDEQKYEILTACTDFITRSYEVPVLKKIIITFHLSDYLAALIQLSFAPLKKPGTYVNFTMTQDLYDQLTLCRQKYLTIYEHLVTNCFQPTLMKELLVLQSMTNPPTPVFAKRVISKEMSRRLLAPGGLLSIIRCFIESYATDTGFEWKKIDMICKIVAAKHGNISQDNYLDNICSQLMQILASNNLHYLASAVSCVLCLNEKYGDASPVKGLVKEVFHTFDYDSLISKSNLPGTIVLSPQEVEHKINILHACTCKTRFDWSIDLLSPNLYVLFLLGVTCTKNEDLKIKLKDTILKCLEELNKNNLLEIMKTFLFGKGDSGSPYIEINEFEERVTIKCVTARDEYPMNDKIEYFFNIFNTSTDNKFVKNVFESLLHMLVEHNDKRQAKMNKEMLFTEDDVIIGEIDEQYAVLLQILSEISTLPKVVVALKNNPSIVLPFVENAILKSQDDSGGCLSISLILLNTILTNSIDTKIVDGKLSKLVPVLMKIAENDSNFNNILCKEALSLISPNTFPQHKSDTACGKALSDVFDNLLPIRAHGLMELTKLIDWKDPETLSKKHYIFCIFQEQLKDPDSYIYLSSINAIASLGSHCPEDALQVLCREFLQISIEEKPVDTKDNQNNILELRMKIGEVIVKVTRKLGEIAVAHKTLLLNTMLCGCRDKDPMIRTSALSNLAEIALVLHFKIGSIIYEILLCIWNIIETDNAIECRRAAVMVISSLLKGLGKETLVQLKENLLPVYRCLKKLYRDSDEDSVIRLHAQIAIEELNDAVSIFLFPELKMEKLIFVMDKPNDVFK